MRRLLNRFLGLLFCCLAGILLAPPGARAGTVCQVVDPQTGLCTIYVESPETPDKPAQPVSSPDSPSAATPCFWDGTDQGITTPPPGPVPCRTSAGYWSNSLDCYVRRLVPQPPASDPGWRGHEPGDGAVYSCYQPQTDLMVNFWSVNPPPGSGGGVTPGEVAQLALEQMRLRAIDVGITPRPDPDSVGVAGMPVWMWVDQPNQATFGPITRTATAGGLAVTATARIEHITWSMGDGATVVCRTAGTPYARSYGATPSPDCGHVYERSSSRQNGGRYTVTATSTWVVTWAGGGQSGAIRIDDLRSTVEIAIGEGQVLVS